MLLLLIMWWCWWDTMMRIENTTWCWWWTIHIKTKIYEEKPTIIESFF
jgi:hypothetical protein